MSDGRWVMGGVLHRNPGVLSNLEWKSRGRKINLVYRGKHVKFSPRHGLQGKKKSDQATS